MRTRIYLVLPWAGGARDGTPLGAGHERHRTSLIVPIVSTFEVSGNKVSWFFSYPMGMNTRHLGMPPLGTVDNVSTVAARHGSV